MAEIWSKPVYTSDPIDILNIKLKRIKKYFKGWGSNVFGNNRIRKNLLKLELQELEKFEESNDLCGEAFVRKTNIMVELNELYVVEESYWHKKNHERWLLKGDRNTDFFHRVANGRKRKNTIRSLEGGLALLKVLRISWLMLLNFIKSYLDLLLGTCVKLIPRFGLMRKRYLLVTTMISPDLLL